MITGMLNDRVKELEHELLMLRDANIELARRNDELNRELSGVRRSYYEERAKVVRMSRGGR